jgi:hypothetical protein
LDRGPPAGFVRPDAGSASQPACRPELNDRKGLRRHCRPQCAASCAGRRPCERLALRLLLRGSPRLWLRDACAGRAGSAWFARGGACAPRTQPRFFFSSPFTSRNVRPGRAARTLPIHRSSADKSVQHLCRPASASGSCLATSWLIGG